MAQLIDTEGDVHQVLGPVSLEKAQELVGGWVQVVQVPGNPAQQMIVNEEGLLENLPYNLIASSIAKQDIVGNAVIVTNGEGWGPGE